MSYSDDERRLFQELHEDQQREARKRKMADRLTLIILVCTAILCGHLLYKFFSL